MNILLLNERTVVLVDTHVNDEPTAEQIAEFTRMAAQAMRRMNLAPKVALLSRSNFGSGSSASGAKMRRALELVRQMEPDLEIDGEMHGDCALDEALRLRILPSSTLKGEANLLVCPNVDSGNIAYNLLKTAAGGNGGGGAVPAGRERAGAHPDFQLDRAPHHQHDGHDGAGRQSRGNVGLSLAPGTRRRGSGQRVPQVARAGFVATCDETARSVDRAAFVIHGPVPRDARAARPALLLLAFQLPSGCLQNQNFQDSVVLARAKSPSRKRQARSSELGGLRRGELDRDRRRDLALGHAGPVGALAVGGVVQRVGDRLVERGLVGLGDLRDQRMVEHHGGRGHGGLSQAEGERRRGENAGVSQDGLPDVEPLLSHTCRERGHVPVILLLAGRWPPGKNAAPEPRAAKYNTGRVVRCGARRAAPAGASFAVIDAGERHVVGFDVRHLAGDPGAGQIGFDLGAAGAVVRSAVDAGEGRVVGLDVPDLAAALAAASSACTWARLGPSYGVP